MAAGTCQAMLHKKHVDAENANCRAQNEKNSAFHISYTEMILKNIWEI